MKLLTTEFEYRNWMVRDFLCIEDDLNCILSPNELEHELLRQMPEEFPCIALIVLGKTPREPSFIHYLYRAQIEGWAAAMGLTVSPV